VEIRVVLVVELRPGLWQLVEVVPAGPPAGGLVGQPAGQVE